MDFAALWARRLLSLSLLAHACTVLAADKLEWRPVSAEERAIDAPRMESGAPAEILYWGMEVDDTDFPDHRRTTDYIRFKIFDPEKAASVTRISRVYYSSGSFTDDKIEIHARLTLPDGTIREFGPEAISERSMARDGAVDSWTGRVFGHNDRGLKEKFLAISGLVPGAIIDYQVRETEGNPSHLAVSNVQREYVPIRRFEYVVRTGSTVDFAYDQYAFNNPTAKLERDDDGRKVTIRAENLPSLPREPFSGARMDTGFSVVHSCVLLRGTLVAEGANGIGEVFSDKTGPWAVTASIAASVGDVFSTPTRKIRSKARELVAGAATELEKARRLHAFVQERYQSYLRLPRAEKPTHKGGLDDLLDDDEIKQVRVADDSFVWLELGLARAAELPVRLLLLPDRDVKNFDPRVVCMHLVQDMAIGYKVGDAWHVSYPIGRVRRAFDELPWQHEGVPALVAQVNQQEFITLPGLKAGQSTVQNFGVLRLSAEGDLKGECRTYYTGHSAAAMRERLWKKTEQEQNELLAKRYREELQAEAVTVTGISGVEAADVSLEVNYEISLPGFAVSAGDRLLLKPFVFRWCEEPLFTADTRKHTVVFPHRWGESDRVMIQLPAGYVPETKESPSSHPGQALNHKASIAYDPKTHALQSSRMWVNNTLYVSRESYSDLKAWCAAVASSDRMDMVLVRATQTGDAAAK